MRNNLALKPDRREVDWAVLGRGVRLAKKSPGGEGAGAMWFSSGGYEKQPYGGWAGRGGLAPRDTNGAERAGRRRRRERVWRGSVVTVSSIRDLCPGRPCSRPLRSRSPEGHVGACAVVIDSGFTVRVWFMHRWLEAECQSPSARRSSRWLPCRLFSRSWGSPVHGPELHAL